MLNDFAVGPPTIDLTSCVSDSCSSLRPWKAFVVSIVVFPSTPVTLPSASAIDPDGTATTTTSASDASPPSRPSAVTSCPAASQRFASPPPTLPRPTTVIFTASPSVDCCASNNFSGSNGRGADIGSPNATDRPLRHVGAPHFLLPDAAGARRRHDRRRRLARHARTAQVHSEDDSGHAGRQHEVPRPRRRAGGHA